MSRGWIPIDKDMIDDPRVMEAAHELALSYGLAKCSGHSGEDLDPVTALKFACNTVTGALVTLWKFADEHIRDDNTLPMTRFTLDAMLGIDDFYDLMPREWVNELDDGTIELPGYCEKNRLIAKRKAAIKSKSRVTAFRARNKVNSNGVTDVHVTQHTPVTQMVDQDQDQDLKSKKKTKAKKETAPTVNVCDIPGLDQAAFNEWLSYRAAIRKPLKPLSLTKAARRLAAMGPAQRAAVDYSIANGYQGVFEPRGQRGNGAGAVRPDHSAEWAEAKARAQAIGFRSPWNTETAAGYMTQVKLAETHLPPGGVEYVLAQLRKRNEGNKTQT